jgi:hypothetical protein
MSYLQTAEELRKAIVSFMNFLDGAEDSEKKAAAVELGHIVNLAVRCSPRPVQGTCRKNIVSAAVRDYCRVSMTREVDPKTGKEFNKIHIEAKE